MQLLPAQPRTGLNSRTWLRGRMAWYLKTESDDWTWAAVADRMNELLGDHPAFGVMDEIEARNSYRRFPILLRQ